MEARTRQSLRQTRGGSGALASYRQGGGSVHCRVPLEASELDCPLAKAGKLPIPARAPQEAGSWAQLFVTQEERIHRARVAALRPGFLFFETAFYRGWLVTHWV